MNNLCDLFSGIKINDQHQYFDMAKRDIFKLAEQFKNFKNYDNSVLELVIHVKTVEPDLYNLNIVLQYIITYGNQLFILCLKEMKTDGYYKNDYEEYLNAYVEDISSTLH
jgi:hypothetical protein